MRLGACGIRRFLNMVHSNSSMRRSPNPVSEVERGIVGLIPAAGTASRISPLPSSKEILPVEFSSSADGGELRVSSSFVLNSMQQAGVQKVYWVLRDGKWDIPSYFGNGARFGLSMAYLVTHVSYGVPFTLREATPFLGNALVVFGLPDILFRPADAFRRLLEHRRATNAAVTLGLFPVERPEHADVVERDRNGRVRQIHIKTPPRQSPKDEFEQAWMMAVWTPAFTEFMSAYLESALDAIEEQEDGPSDELFLGTVFQAAINAGYGVEAVSFTEGQCIDIGTPEGLMQIFSANPFVRPEKA